MMATIAHLSAVINPTPLADWHHDGWGWWWALFVPLFWLLAIGVVIVLVRGRARHRGWGPPPWVGERQHETALAVLERRYAEGAIDVDEYRERRAVLSEHPEPI